MSASHVPYVTLKHLEKTIFLRRMRDWGRMTMTYCPPFLWEDWFSVFIVVAVRDGASC